MERINIPATKKQIRLSAGSQAEYFRLRGINPQSAATMLTPPYFAKWYPPKPGTEFAKILEQLRTDKLLVREKRVVRKKNTSAMNAL